MKLIIEIKKSLRALGSNDIAFQRICQSEDDRQINVDWDFFKSVNFNKQNLINTRKQAIKLSLTKNIYSVHLFCLEDDDPIIQEFFENGIMTKMF